MVFDEDMEICSGFHLKMFELLKTKTQSNKGVLFKVSYIVYCSTHTGWKLAVPGLLNHNMDLKKGKKFPDCDSTILEFLYIRGKT